MPDRLTIEWLRTSGAAVEADGGLLVRVKAVPGARHSEISGLLGDRLKIRVAAPPEGGKANKAVCELLATALGVKGARVSVERGRTTADKVVRIGF